MANLQLEKLKADPWTCETCCCLPGVGGGCRGYINIRDYNNGEIGIERAPSNTMRIKFFFVERKQHAQEISRHL